MKKLTAFFAESLLILVPLVMIVGFTGGTLWAGEITWNVPGNYLTIQLAVNAAPEGATINVEAGTYNEAITVNKPLTLTGGFGGGTSTIGGGNQMIITANSVTVSNFTFTGNFGSGACILLDSDNAHSVITISNNTFLNAITSWHLIRAGGNKTNLSITGNTFTGSTGGDDNAIIYLGTGGGNIIISNNSFSNIPSTYGTYAIQHNGAGSRTAGMTINSNTINFTGHNGSSEGIQVRYADNVTINGNTLTGSATATLYQVGIDVASVTSSAASSVISNNTVSGFSYNMRLTRWNAGEGLPNSVTITTNSLSGGVSYTGYEFTGTGLILSGTNMMVEANQITGNAVYGIIARATVGDGGANDVTGSRINNNNLSGNGTWGVRNLSPSPALPALLDATNNWWGDNDPSNDVSGSVDYTPWIPGEIQNSDVFTVTVADPAPVTNASAGITVDVAGAVGTGTVGSSSYTGTPTTAQSFSVGTGNTAAKYVDVYVTGLIGGTAKITVSYTDPEVSAFVENTLKLYMWYGIPGAWHLGTSPGIDTVNNLVWGTFNVTDLTGSPGGLGGSFNPAYIPTLNEWGLIILVVIIASIAAANARKRKSQGFSTSTSH